MMGNGRETGKSLAGIMVVALLALTLMVVQAFAATIGVQGLLAAQASGGAAPVVVQVPTAQTAVSVGSGSGGTSVVSDGTTSAFARGYVDIHGTPTILALLELDGRDLAELLQQEGFSWDDTAYGWVRPDGASLIVATQDGTIDQDAFLSFAKGEAASTFFYLTATGYVSAREALNGTSEVVTEDIFSMNDASVGEGLLAVVYGPSMEEHLVLIVHTDGAYMLQVYSESCIESGLFGYLMGSDTGSTIEEVWQNTTGYPVGEAHFAAEGGQASGTAAASDSNVTSDSGVTSGSGMTSDSGAASDSNATSDSGATSGSDSAASTTTEPLVGGLIGSIMQGGSQGQASGEVAFDSACYDTRGNPTLFALCSLSGADLTTLLEQLGFAWDDNAGYWVREADHTSLFSIPQSGELSKGAFLEMGEGGAVASVCYINVSGYSSAEEAFAGICDADVTDAATSNSICTVAYSSGDDAVMALSYLDAADQKLVIVSDLGNGNYTVQVYTELAASSGVFDEVFGGSYGDTLSAIWESITGRPPAYGSMAGQG